MSTIQKAFVFIVLVLALLTAAVNLVLFAQRTNWKDAATTKDKEVADLQAKANAAEKRGQETASSDKTEILNLQTQVATLTGNVKEAQDALENTRADKATMEGMVTQLTAKVDLLASNAAAQEARLQELDKAKAAAEARGDSEASARQNAEEALAVANRSVKDLSAKVDAFTEQVAARDEEIKNLRQKVDVMAVYAPQIGQVATPAKQRIFGTISGISQDGTIVYLTVGSDDGVKNSQLFLIYKSDGTYVAQAEIYDVSAHKSAARVIPSPVGEIAEGDNVANK